MKKRMIFSQALIIGMLVAPVAFADTVYDLNIVTDNGGYGNDPGAIFRVAVSEAENDGDDDDRLRNGDDTLVRFDIMNASTVPAVVAEIYFEHGSLDSLLAFIEGPGTDFSLGASPPNLPGGQELNPPFVSWVSLDANNPAPVHGINPNEYLSALFSLAPGATLQTITDQMDAGNLRVGMHIIGFPDGSSEAAITPEPYSGTLLLGALAMLSAKRPRRDVLQR